MQRALFSNEAGQGSAPIAHSAAKTDEPVREGVVAGLEPFVDTLCVCTITALVILLSGTWNRGPGLQFAGEPPQITRAGDAWQAAPTPVKVIEVGEAAGQMREGTTVYLVVEAGLNKATGMDRHKLTGHLEGSDQMGWTAVWDPIKADVQPKIVVPGVFFAFKGATLTAKAYDRVLAGLGLWIVPATAFLFAYSTMISWSYYGEQGIVFLAGPRAVMPYRLVYCALILFSCSGLVKTENELDIVSTLGTGVMLWVNIPIMLIFGPMAMKAYHEYMGRLKRGEFKGHGYPKITDVVEGKDV
jgi:AGCS family alanine or glycine:cation symporter